MAFFISAIERTRSFVCSPKMTGRFGGCTCISLPLLAVLWVCEEGQDSSLFCALYPTYMSMCVEGVVQRYNIYCTLFRNECPFSIPCSAPRATTVTHCVLDELYHLSAFLQATY